MAETWDLVLYDDKNAWSPSLNASGRGGQGVGGFEVQMVQIATAAAKAGHEVLALNPCGGDQRWEDGVLYRDAKDEREIVCRTLLTARDSRIPKCIGTDNVLTSCVDDPSGEPPGKFDHLRGRSTLVHLSEWQMSLYEDLGHRRGVVVPSMIDDWVYGYGKDWTVPRTGGYVCVNAWNKGTDATLRMWRELGLSSVLRVGSPYGAPEDAYDRCVAYGAHWMGQLTPRQIVRALARAEAVFRVCERPETFGVTDAIAEVVGARVHCLCTNGYGAAQQVLRSPFVDDDPTEFASDLACLPDYGPAPPKDYRVSTVMPQWLKVLGLEG